MRHLRKLTRVAIYGIAIQEDKILLTVKKRGPLKELLDLPGGAIEHGESLEEALRREFREEVAMTFDSLHHFGNLTHNMEVLEAQDPYHWHAIGLLYKVNGLTALPGALAEEVFRWYPLKELNFDQLTPFAREAVKSSCVM